MVWPTPSDPGARAMQDEELFQTAWLIKYVVSRKAHSPLFYPLLSVVATYMSSIIGDYVVGFLGARELTDISTFW
jgi:hypothetical protein